MGCLNYTKKFDHCFGNIHLSGPCNRSCYFCIGQYMPGQDMNNNLTGELRGLDAFIAQCKLRGVTEVNITGTNTDPLMRDGLIGLCQYLRSEGFTNIGIRTNAVQHDKLIAVIPYIDKFSVSITSFDPAVYKTTMGSGTPPDLQPIIEAADAANVPIKLNVVLCPENVKDGDILTTISRARDLGIVKINFREPYGQARIGDVLAARGYRQTKTVFGNPCYEFVSGTTPYIACTYWDVHYTEVESINLYADGRISTDYPITLGHSEELGAVKDQSNFEQGRQREQWVGTKMEKTA